jgi:hypothetical protein
MFCPMQQSLIKRYFAQVVESDQNLKVLSKFKNSLKVFNFQVMEL